MNRKFLQDTVQGYLTKWVVVPPQCEFKNSIYKKEHIEFYHKEINRLVKTGALVPVPAALPKFVHPVAIAEGRKLRVIVRGEFMNFHSPKHSVKLPSIADILMRVEEGYWAFSWDGLDAFYSSPAHPKEALWNCIARKAEGGGTEYFAFIGRPMGRNDSPYDYVRSQRHIEKYLASVGILLVMFMDDQLGQSPPHPVLFKCITNFVKGVLNRLMQITNQTKNQFEAEQGRIKFVGLIIDTIKCSATLTDRNLERTISAIENLLAANEKEKATARGLVKALGKVVSTNAVVQHTAILTAALKRQLKHAHEDFDLTRKKEWENVVKLSPESVSELKWLLINIPLFRERAIWNGHWDADIWTDASDSMAAGHSALGVTQTQLSEELKNQSSTAREACAVLFKLVDCLPQLRGKRIRFISDSLSLTTALQRNGSRSGKVTTILRLIKAITLKNKISFWMRWVRRSTYGLKLADHISKTADFSEWISNRRVLDTIFKSLEWQTPTIDGFANASNRVAPRYFNRSWDGQAVSHNVLSDSSFKNYAWEKEVTFFNPPYDDRIMEQTIELIMARRFLAFLLVPIWSRSLYCRRLQDLGDTFVRIPRDARMFAAGENYTLARRTPKTDTVLMRLNGNGRERKRQNFFVFDWNKFELRKVNN